MTPCSARHTLGAAFGVELAVRLLFPSENVPQESAGAYEGNVLLGSVMVLPLVASMYPLTALE